MQYAEKVAESLQKGLRDVVQGRLRQRSYENDQGEPRTVYEVDVEEVRPALRYATAKGVNRSCQDRLMVTVIPSDPAFVTESERTVFQTLLGQLGAQDILICNQHFSRPGRDHEVDLIVVFAGLGVVVVEIKGGGVAAAPDGWSMTHAGRREPIDPVGQVLGNRDALIDYLKQHTSFAGFHAWTVALVLPFTRVDDDMALPDIRREQVAGRDDMPQLASFLRRILEQREIPRPFGAADRERILHAMRGIALPQRDLQAAALEHEATVERRSQEQSVILDAAVALPRLHIRGGAGTGKTWLAVEHARRLAAEGQRVALMCYSRGLAAWLCRRIALLPADETPAYVGTFHGLGMRWGAPEGSDDDSDYWEHQLPAMMSRLAAERPSGERFDAIVVDEGQDFADDWWTAVLAALRDDSSRLAVFTDEGQQVFARFGRLPGGLVPLVLDRNLRNTRQVAESFETLAPIRMRLGDLEGPGVRLVECAAEEAVACSDDAVDELLDAGWRPQDVALLCTGSRHPEQRERQAEGQDRYWESFWDDDQVFYGHVLGFKGLEREAVVLAVNDSETGRRAKEKLYVGLSRARQQLVVCGDPAYIEQVGGAEVLRRIRGR